MTCKSWALVLALGAWTAAGCKASSVGASSPPPGVDPRLQSLVVAGDAATALLPSYDKDTHLYSVVLSSALTTASVTATPSAGVPSVTVSQLGVGTATVAGGTAVPFAVPDPGGTSTVRVVSTTPDGKASAGYTLQLTRRTALGTDGSMASITDSLGRLSFAPATSTYAYNILQEETDGYTLTATTSDPLASLTVNGEPAQSGRPFAPSLALGDNALTFVTTSEDGQAQTSYTVTVTVVPTIPVTGVTLSCPPYIGNGDLVAPTIIPANATDTAVTWTSSNGATAAFDASGHVVVVKPTKQFDPPITITATTHDGGFQASCDVHVLWFYDNFEDLPVGAATSIRKWNLLPVGGPNGAFSITSDGSNVLTYTAGGVGGVLATLADAAWPAGLATNGDYYVEARIKPMTNSTTANKQLYLVARYQDPSNWYAAGLNMQTSSPSRVEMAKDASGTVAAPNAWRFTNKNPVMGTWYTVRLEVVGSSATSSPAGPSLTMYLDGEKLGTVTDATAPLFASGKIGLFTNNKSFEIDEVKVGDPADRPPQLAISPNTSYAADVGDAARVVTVTAQKPNYTSGAYDADTFTAVSSDPAVVSVSISGNEVSLTPLGAGPATVTFTSGSDPTLTRQITATITSFSTPTTTYNLTGRVTPAAAATGINADTQLSITFDSPPTLGTGSVRIFRSSDDAQIDVIRPTGELDSYGYPGQSAIRMLNVVLLKVSGNTLTIIPHHNALAYGTQYYVRIPTGFITGNSLAGTAFDGLGKPANWSFTTRAAPATTLTSLTVDAGGAGDFSTVQGALDYFMQNAATDAAVTVNVNNGTYDGPLFLRSKNNLTILGQSRTGAVIQFRNAEALNSGSGGSQPPGGLTPTGGRAVFLVEACDMLTLQNLTLKNTTPRSSSGAQAEVIYFNNDTGRLVAKQANFFSEQDTLQLKGYNWFYQSLVAGNVDYIWGTSHAALFESSEIRTIGDTANSTSGWYIVQARVASNTDKGFVFLNSQLTHGAGPVTGDVTTNVYLARAQNGAWSDQVVYVNCAMDTHIMPAGWYTGTTSTPVYPNPNPATQTAGWREYGSTKLSDGTALDVSGRSAVSAQLTSTTYSTGYSTRAQIFAAYNSGAGWNPTP